MKSADRENSHGVRFGLLTLLLAISFGFISEANASVEAAASGDFFASSIRMHHCCRIEAETSDPDRADNEKQLPCKCGSQYNEKLRTAILSNSVYHHFNDDYLPQLHDTLYGDTQIGMPTFSTFMVDPIPIYLLTTRLLI